MTNPRKSKALPGAFADADTATIREAYAELTRKAFAVWIRMNAEHPSVWKAGRLEAAKLLDYSPRQCDEILKELGRKGFIKFIPPDYPGATTEIVLRRRALINTRTTSFSSLSNALLESLDGQVLNRSRLNFGEESIKLWCRVGLNFEEFEKARDNSCRVLSTKLVNRREDGESIDSTISRKKDGETLPPKPIFRGKKQRLKLTNTLVEQSSRPRVDIRALRSSKEKDRIDRLASRREAGKRNSSRKGKPVNWSQLDRNGKPAVSFEPSHPGRKAMLDVLSRNARDGERKGLIEKLTTEFCRIYTRYRKQAERRETGFSVYEVTEGERVQASKSAILCLQKGVTPSHLVEYWDANVRNFTDMKIPTVGFLASANNIDRAACHVMPAKARPGEKPKAGNSFSEVKGLDVRIRPGLEAAGFDTRAFNDRYMLGVQHNALSLAQGKRIYVGKTKAGDMARWVAKEIFMKASDEE